MFIALIIVLKYNGSFFITLFVFIVGDLNDSITDSESSNVFNNILNDSTFYFADMSIALGTTSNWSFPTYPSHIDHIIINSNILDYPNIIYETQTLLVENIFSGGFSEYDSYVSDHRPVLINFDIPISD